MKLFYASLDPNYPNLKQSLLLAFLYFTSFLLFWMIATMPLLVVWPLPETYRIFLHSVASPVCTFPLIIYVSWKSGISFKWELKSPGIQLVLLLTLLAISTRIILQPLINPVDYFNTLISGKVRVFDYNLPEFNSFWLIDSIFIALIVPIFEEIFWRKQILGLLQKKYSQTVAIVLGSAFFACAHLQLNNIGALFIWGLLFSFVYYKTKSLEASIFLHSLTNLTSRFRPGCDYIEVKGPQFINFIIAMVICAIIIYLIIRYINRYDKGVGYEIK